MHDISPFELPNWIADHSNGAKLVLAGSATPALSVRDLISLSTDPAETTKKLSVDSLPLALGSKTGNEALRNTIAAFYNNNISASDIITTNGATGANALVFQTLLKAGDHVISMYPSYTQLLDMPQAITGTEISLWDLNLNNQAAADIEALKRLITPRTKIIVLNNPNNPTGTMLSLDLHREILSLAHALGIFVLVDEIFRPLYHDLTTPLPSSFVEEDGFDNVIVTGSLSKAWGLAGVRVGWLATRNKSFLRAALNIRLYTVMATGTLNEVIATEALSERCRPQILAKHLDLAQANLGLLEAFVEKNNRAVSWVKPRAGATAFVRFMIGGVSVDDVDFCIKLKKETGVLLAPGSRCFGARRERQFGGFVRVHLTCQPENMRRALEAIGQYLERIGATT